MEVLRPTRAILTCCRGACKPCYPSQASPLTVSQRSYQFDDRSSLMPLHDRLYYLAQALTSAKSAASLGSEDVEFTSRLQEQIDVAQVQMEVAHAVEVHPEMTGEEKVEILASLNDGLLQLDEVSVDNS